MVPEGKILLIDDDPAISGYLREKLLENVNYSLAVERDTEAGIQALRHGNFDLVVVKLGIRDLDSRDLVKGLKKADPDCIIIALVDDSYTQAVAEELSRLGVYDFITRAVNPEKLYFLIRKGVELHTLTSTHNKLIASVKEQNSALQKQNTLLAKRIEESTKNLTRLYEDLRATYMRTIKVLAHAIDARDHYTHSHSENVAKYAALIAAELRLSANDIELIREACELHDLGKIGVEDNVLGKSASLTEEEWEQIKRHPVTGAQILEPLTFLDGVIDLIRQHHERYDGLGYPLGLKGEEILLGARIINLADAYEAMTSARSYRKNPLTKEEAIEEVKRNSGKQFDPKVVAAFLKVVDKI